MVTKEWVAIHRKHHAKCETVDDPHSPVNPRHQDRAAGGSELYRTEAKNVETISKFGHDTPDDWIERNLYSRFSWQGVAVMMIIDLSCSARSAPRSGRSRCCGSRSPRPASSTASATTGATAISRRRRVAQRRALGLIIGGEELHNNHHTYPTSAKLSVKPYEFDIGWAYIRGLEMLGLAKVRKTPPQLRMGHVRPVADSETLEAIIANRYEVMAKYAREMRRACGTELARLRAQGAENTPRWANMRLARRWLHRDNRQDPGPPPGPGRRRGRAGPGAGEAARDARGTAPALDAHERLGRATRHRPPGLVQRAEESGIESLREFSLKLRAARA
jgi:stearoyl-CoA desaturase (delta-9 desaturase)